MSDSYAGLREHMVADQIAARGVHDPRVLEVMRSVPRHMFVPEPGRIFAYADQPLPIGQGQTISQPYIVACMTEALGVGEKDIVLEVGSGCGYQGSPAAPSRSTSTRPDATLPAAASPRCLRRRQPAWSPARARAWST